MGFHPPPSEEVKYYKYKRPFLISFRLPPDSGRSSAFGVYPVSVYLDIQHPQAVSFSHVLNVLSDTEFAFV